MKKSRGFTLIELLVVVAIIALLIAILLPALGKAKTVAVRTKCLAVLKNWGTAINLYITESGGVFFIKQAGQGWNSNVNQYQAEWAAAGIMKAQRVCPGSDAAAIAGNTTAYAMIQYNASGATPDQYMATYTETYAFTTPTGQPVSNTGGSMSYKLAAFKYASDTVLLFDAAVPTGNAWISSMASQQMTSPGLHDALAARHQGTGGVLFLDFHGETRPFADYAQNIPTVRPVPAAESAKQWTRVGS